MTFRQATTDDCALLAELNHQLIQDEGHRNRMTVPELEQRMKGWLSGEYRAVLFKEGNEVVAYALFREQPEEIYLRQLFVVLVETWQLWPLGWISSRNGPDPLPH